MWFDQLKHTFSCDLMDSWIMINIHVIWSSHVWRDPFSLESEDIDRNSENVGRILEFRESLGKVVGEFQNV